MWTSYHVLALATIASCQNPNTAPPPPSGPASPSGPAPLATGSAAVTPPNAPLITIGGSPFGTSVVGGMTVAADPSGAYVIGSQTLNPGSAITVHSTVYSLPSGGRYLVANGRTSSISEGAGGYVPNVSVGATSSYAAYNGSVSSSSYGSSGLGAATTGSGSISPMHTASAADRSSSVAAAGSSASSAPAAMGNGAMGRSTRIISSSMLWGVLMAVIGLLAW